MKWWWWFHRFQGKTQQENPVITRRPASICYRYIDAFKDPGTEGDPRRIYNVHQIQARKIRVAKRTPATARQEKRQLQRAAAVCVAHQVDDLLSPCGAGLDVRAHEHVTVPSLEGVDQIVQALFL